MQWAKRWFLASVVSWGLMGCAGSAKPVRSVAEYDLSCGKVEVERLASDRYAAYGCGRGAMYVESCDAGGCRWARMRHGHEDEIANRQGAPLPAITPAPREVVPAPTPEQRQVLPAPEPAPRQVTPAPAPVQKSAPAASSGGEAPANTQDVQGQVTPLSQGDLSDPYQAEVPAQPTTQQVSYAPPEPLVEERPPAPSVTHIWVGGYWWWSTPGWMWVPGYWCPPRPGFVFVSSYWYWNAGWWWWYPGGFAYPGTTTIIYAPSPRPQRVATVRTFRPHRVVHTTPSRRVESRPTVTSSGGYRPTQSPLVRYPAPRVVAQHHVAQKPMATHARATAQGSRGIGRVVSPNASRPTYHSSPSRGTSQIQRGARVDQGSLARPRIQSSAPPRAVRPSGPPPRTTQHSQGGAFRGGSPRVVRPR